MEKGKNRILGAVDFNIKHTYSLTTKQGSDKVKEYVLAYNIFSKS